MSARAAVVPNERPTPRRLIEALMAPTSTVEADSGDARRYERKRQNDAAVSARKAAWIRASSSTVGEYALVSSSQTARSQAALTVVAAFRGLTQVEAASTSATKPTTGSSQTNDAWPGADHPNNSTAGSARARTAIVRSRTRRRAGYGVTISGSRAGSTRQS